MKTGTRELEEGLERGWGGMDGGGVRDGREAGVELMTVAMQSAVLSELFLSPCHLPTDLGCPPSRRG
ncbi:hypothetical protein BaRGS_00018574 [Batillaria attramentaria]|uniref:Uncharacterized protein n=1 Tax=Batillaria attramentaria TaxID=370345 RepID=A0ABD0KSP2_9CAEN